MINILSYVGINLQAEVCIWALLGLVRTMFDATLFKVNSHLKQVWQMKMPAELTYYVQRVFRTMISGLVLVQCFTVYVYLATYIVLLYPAFLEDRPTLVIPWLLLAAIRSLLCELLSLALGLATCVLLGPARAACLKFVVRKIVTIAPSVYMWMLVYSYYYSIKLTAARTAIKSMVLPGNKNDNDGFLELAVRRRRTKSLLTEEELRKIITNSYGEKSDILKKNSSIDINLKKTWSSRNVNENFASDEFQPFSIYYPKDPELNTSDDLLNIDVVTPRDTDRILDQFVTMLLKIGIYLAKGYNSESLQQLNMKDDAKLKDSPTGCDKTESNPLHLYCDEADVPPAVSSNSGFLS